MRILLLIVAVILAPFGCAAFPVVLDKTHKTVVAAGKTTIEPKLASTCLARAKKCVETGIQDPLRCDPLKQCRGWKKLYASSKASLDTGLAGMNRVYFELVSAGIIKEGK